MRVPALSAREFDRLAIQVWRELQPLIPDDLKAHFDKIQILIEDRPSAQILVDLLGTGLEEDPDSLCGLHVGVPLTEQSVVFPSLFPARVYLFRAAILDLAEFDGTRAAKTRLRQELAITLLHEVGHFFGLDEEDLDRLGLS